MVDTAMGELLAELDDTRYRRMTDNAESLYSAGHLRPGVTLQVAADLMWSVSAPEMFELLVRRRGWSLEQYADFPVTVPGGLVRLAAIRRRTSKAARQPWVEMACACSASLAGRALEGLRGH